MKKNIFIATTIASLLLASWLLAQVPERQFQPKPLRWAALDLTNDQMAKIQDMELNLEKEIIPLRSQMPAIEANLKQELIADQFSQAKVKTLIDQNAKILSEIELKQFLNQRAIRDLLTPEQRKKFDLQVLKEGLGQHQKPLMPIPPHQPGVEMPPPGMEK